MLSIYLSSIIIVDESSLVYPFSIDNTNPYKGLFKYYYLSVFIITKS